MKKLLITLLTVGLIGSATLGVSVHSAEAAKKKQTCTVANLRNKANARFWVNGNNLDAYFTVPQFCKPVRIAFASYKAPNGQNGRPLTQQTFYKSTFGVFGSGRHKLSIQLPNCYYQADLFFGYPVSKWAHPQNAWLGSHKRLIDGKVGTNNPASCNPTTPQPPVPPTPPTTEPPVTVTTTNKEVVVTEALPNTGPGAIVASGIGVSMLASLAYSARSYSRKYKYILNNLF